MEEGRERGMEGEGGREREREGGRYVPNNAITQLTEKSV